MERFLPGFVALCLVLVLPTDAAAGRFGPWELGMTREEVQSFSDFGPYRPVSATGGLETPNGRFLGEKTPVSFVFDESGCHLIQVWAYEGTDEKEAVRSFFRVYRYLVGEFGEVATDGEPWASDLSLRQIEEKVPPRFFDHSAELTIQELQARGRVETTVYKLHVHPRVEPDGARIYGSLLKNSRLRHYWVFLYVRSP